MLRLFGFCVLYTMLALLISCKDEEEPLFSELNASHTGIDFVNENHETELSNILSYEYFYNGGGVAIGDINNDGLADVYLTSNTFENRLYLNLGDLRFKDITEESGTASEEGWKTGVTMADVNGDGLLDIYVCRSASPNPDRRKNLLYINQGDLTFKQQAAKHGLDDTSYSTQAVFFDFDRDGDLDMLLLNHSLLEISNSFNITVKNSNVRFPEVGNKLYRNDNGFFNDVSDDMGVYGSGFNYGLGVSVSDVNNDGWPDIYVGCDYTGRDKLLINKEGKFFSDATYEQLSHISKFTMGTDIADINGDGLMDLLTLDMLPEDNYRQKQLMGVDPYDVHSVMVKNGLHAQYMRNMLHLNNGNGTFSEIGQLAGISATDWSWGGLIQDYDNDGVSDIFISNGFKRDLTNNDFAKYKAAQEVGIAKKNGQDISVLNIINEFDENKIPNYMFRGNGDLTFSNVTSTWGFDKPLITNGIAYGDLDNDGDLDLITNNMNERAGVYRNNSDRTGNSFLSIELEDSANTFGVGAKVTVYTGDSLFCVEQFPVRGFQSSVDNVLHFGLGKTQKIDSVYVRWPGGWCTRHMNAAVNRRMRLASSDGQVVSCEPRPGKTLFSTVDTLGTDLDENAFVDFNVQALLPRFYSTQGPALALGDVNGDGLQDLYVGSPKGKTGRLLIQSHDGTFSERNQSAFQAGMEAEEVDAVFFDVDGDLDLDLYVVTGGYEFSPNDKMLFDILYLNDGKGYFSLGKLPELSQSGSCARVTDIDNDGDKDLFIGGRIVPGRYPETPDSYVLINNGSGVLSVDSSYSRSVQKIGMVTDASWIQLNTDSFPDLVIVGEWMSIKFLVNTGSALVDESQRFLSARSEGFWNCVLAADFDKDGDIDMVAGNNGLNGYLRPSREHPVMMYFDDYDDNGSVDPILEHWVRDGLYPYPTRDELFQQLPSFKKKFPDYSSYSSATISSVLSSDELIMSERFIASTFESCYLENTGGHFEIAPLPVEFQFAPIYSFVAADVNGDSQLDLVAGGNLSGTRARTGKLTGNYGIVGLGPSFSVVKPQQSGLCIRGDVRRLLWDNDQLYTAINNMGVVRIKVNHPDQGVDTK